MTAFISKIKTLWKDKRSLCMYVLFGIVSLITFTSMFIWVLVGGDTSGIIISDAILVKGEGVRQEYLMDETFDATGISLNIGSSDAPNIIDVSNCQMSYDFTSAGKKRVSVTYQETASQHYVAYLDVTVLFVRRLTVITPPTSITVNPDGTFTTDEDFTIHAELSSLPTDTETFVPVQGKQNTVVLKPNTYKAIASENIALDGYYSAQIICGSVRHSFNFYNKANKTFLVDSEKSVVPFANDDQNSNSTLTLVVTNAPDTYQYDCVGESNGYYVYTDSQGESKVTPFNYQLKETAEVFKSPTSTNLLLSEYKSGDDYKVTFSGETFTANPNLWQSAVVNGYIYSDGEYKLVIESDARVLSLTPTEAGATETLTLYI
ncbi:MAG: hypothetical protein E7369_01590, partial [Clostridiales bacterium]|nr:hypothetical protein [Clostridiales bacterium]